MAMATPLDIDGPNPVIYKDTAECKDNKRGNNERPQNSKTAKPYEADWNPSLPARVLVASPTCIAVRTMAM